MEFCKVALTFESVDEILWCDHSKALCLYLHMVYLFFKILQNEICKSSRNLPLATFGSERVKTSNDIYAIRWEEMHERAEG